jgi:hypothetical protein
MKLFEGFHSNVTFCAMAQEPLVEQGLLVPEAAGSHSETPQSVGLLCTGDQLDSETSTWQQIQPSQGTDKHAAGRIRTRNPSKHAAARIGYISFRVYFSQQIFEESSNVNFLEFSPAAAELFQTDGRTDITNVIVAFRGFQKAPNNILTRFKMLKKELTFKHRRLSSICAILPLLLSLAFPAHASPFQFSPIPKLLLTQRQCSLTQKHAGDCIKQHCPLHGEEFQTDPVCHHVWQLIMLNVHMSLPALCLRLHNNCMLVYVLNCFLLYIHFLGVHFDFVKSNVGSQSSGTWLHGQHAFTLKYERSFESQHVQCKDKMSPTESTLFRRIRLCVLSTTTY